FPPDQLALMVQETRPALFLTQARLLAGLDYNPDSVICLDTDWDVIAAEPMVAPVVSVSRENLLTVVFTSGSTGRPKAVPFLHRSLFPSSWARLTFPLTPADRHVLKTTLDSSLLIREVFWPLQVGARIVIAGQGENQDPAALVQLITQHQITFL